MLLDKLKSLSKQIEDKPITVESLCDINKEAISKIDVKSEAIYNLFISYLKGTEGAKISTTTVIK